MATHMRLREYTLEQPLIRGRTFDIIFLLACVWLQIGIWYNLWVQQHMKQAANFLMMGRAMLYSGILVAALTLLIPIGINRLRGASWRHTISPGYDLSLLGLIGLLVGSIDDAVWHTFFGIGSTSDLQFSPSHLSLLISTGLFLLGPLRSLYRREHRDGVDNILLVGAISQLLLLLNNNARSFHPFVDLWPSTTSQMQTMAMVSILLHGALLTGIVLYTIRRWELFAGFFALVLTLSSFPLSLLSGQYIGIVMALSGGLIIDGVYLLIQPSLEQTFRLRLFAALSIAGFYLMYFLSLQVTVGVFWTFSAEESVIGLVGLIGWLLTYLMVPPERFGRNSFH